MKLQNEDGSFSEVTALLNPTDDAFDVAVRVEGSDEFVSVPKYRLWYNGKPITTKVMPQPEIVHGPRESRGMLAMSDYPYRIAPAALEGDDDDDVIDVLDVEVERVLCECGFGSDYFEDRSDDLLNYEDFFGDFFDDERASA